MNAMNIYHMGKIGNIYHVGEFSKVYLQEEGWLTLITILSLWFLDKSIKDNFVVVSMYFNKYLQNLLFPTEVKRIVLELKSLQLTWEKNR
jgi:hypothetical protein